MDKYTFLYWDEDTDNWYIYKYNPISMEYMLIGSSIKREGLKAIVRIVEHMEEKPSIDESSFEIFDSTFMMNLEIKIFYGK